MRAIELLGSDIRKRGLWKDITNKALGGLPGVQKEGTDGVITSAEFILYPAYPQTRTLCLEFFGPDFDEASQVILEIAREMPNRGEEALSALEHFDDQYVKAIGYQVKAPRAETPKAVIIVDVVGHSPEEVARGVARIRAILAPHTKTFLAEARDAAEGKRFWADRKKLGAIARRTNAFKVNEDVVLPLSALAEFSLFIDAMNVHEERHCQENFVRRAETYLRGVPTPEDALWAPKLEAALSACGKAREAVEKAGEAEVRSLAVTDRLRQDLAALLGTHPKVAATLGGIWDEVRARLIVLATHMHAGDGNVHVNIPVLSNDRQMLRRSEAVVEKVFERVGELGGVVSGEHGIGVTKLKYWDPERRKELEAYRRGVDPGGLMNPGKLSDLAALEQIYTPSFNLLKLEARILQHGQLEELARRIATCVRCGKCKPDCCVFYPARGMFFHPRNKNLAIGALIEALLYDAQRQRSGSFELLRHLEEVADHCTICHKCLKPCPVDIDTGEVTVIEREILAAQGFKQMPLATRLTLRYLDTRSRLGNRILRAGLVSIGGALQRAGHEVTAPLQKLDGSSRLLATLRSPVTPADEGTLRDVVPECRADQALLFEPAGEARRTVFYFPGCGSERLFSRISQAAIHVLLETGTRVVIPPPFLCCGFPAHANALTGQHGRTVLRDTILFSQIRDMLSHLEFDAVVVSCGTCMDGLEGMEVEKIFGAPVTDAVGFALDAGLELPGTAPAALYHTPCHDSLRGAGIATLRRAGFEAAEVPHCCSEAGTLALSRPDITDSMLHRKAGALTEAMESRPAGTVMLTNCPSCVQGLGRNAELGAVARHLAVEAASRLSGPGWPERFRSQAQQAKVIQL